MTEPSSSKSRGLPGGQESPEPARMGSSSWVGAAGISQGLLRHKQAAFSSGAGRKEMQSLHGKCLQRTKAAGVKSDSGNRRLARLCGCVSLHSSSSSCCCLSLLALPGIPGWMQPNIPVLPFPAAPQPPLPASLPIWPAAFAGANWISSLPPSPPPFFLSPRCKKDL